MDNIRAAMIIDAAASPLEAAVRARAAAIVIRMCEDHSAILAMLGLIDPPADSAPLDPAVAADVPTCKYGHPQNRENRREVPRGGYRCRLCENLARQRRRQREKEHRETYGPSPTTPAGDRTPAAVHVAEAVRLLGVSGREYRRVYGVSAAVAEAVVEAVRLGDAEMLEQLKKENR